MQAMRIKTKQNGAALAISLILLVAMTVLGVATLNSTRLAEKVSSNAQQKAIVFETAESVLESINASTDFANRLLDSRTSMVEPDPVVQTAETTLINTELDQTSMLKNQSITSVDVTSDASIQFCGEFPLAGTGISADESDYSKIGLHFDIRVNASIANSKAKASHVQRVEDSGVRFNATGKCITPGT